MHGEHKPEYTRPEPEPDPLQDNSLTADLTALIQSKPVTDEDLEAAALFVLDAAANIAAARKYPPGRIMMSWARDCCGVPGPDAGRNALIGGGLCHMLESDDLHRASVVHPGCAVIPAALALADCLPEVSGRQVLTSVLWGYEAAIRVGMAVGPGHYKVWHNTGTCGPFGSAMAAACLIGLSEAQTINALGNAGTQSAGLWQFLADGAMSKFLHAGRAAEAGLVSAQLAERGFTGAARILEGGQGMFAGACPDPEPDAVLADPDQPWQLHLTSIKPWPCCRHTHGPIAAGLAMHDRVAALSLPLDDIAGIELATYQAALDVCDQPRPDSDYAAKFSLQHCIAAALREGRVVPGSFEEGARREAAGLAANVTLRADAALDAAYPLHWGCALTAKLRNGEKIEIVKHDAKGDPEDPLSPSDLIDKAGVLLRQAVHGNSGQLIDQALAMATGGAPVSLRGLLA